MKRTIQKGLIRTVSAVRHLPTPVVVKRQLDMVIQWSSTVSSASAGATNLHMMAESSYVILSLFFH